MRIRSIKPEFWESDDIDGLNWDDRLVFIGIWSYVDDNGVGIDKLSRIASDLFGSDLTRDAPETLRRVSSALLRLAKQGLISRYEVEGKRYLHVTTWAKHQRVDHPNKQRYPLPTCENVDPQHALVTPSGDPLEDLAPGAVEQRNRGTEEQKEKALPRETREAAPATKKPRKVGTRIPDDWLPTTDLVAWVRHECPNVDGRTETANFKDWATAATGTNSIKADWNAAFRTWMRRAQKEALEHSTRRNGSQAAHSPRPNAATERHRDSLATLERLAAAEQTGKQPSLAIGA